MQGPSWKTDSSGFICRVILDVLTIVSEEPTVLKMKAGGSSETLVTTSKLNGEYTQNINI
jgi:hypothetical protein